MPPRWLVVLLVYGLSRLLTTGLLLLAYWVTAGRSFAQFDGAPGFAGFLESWDGLHYAQIATGGYPLTLPVDGFGNVLQNPWAFLPLYPWLSRALMNVTGLDFAAAGVIIALLFGAGAALLLHRLLEPRVGAVAALWATVFFCFAPMSFVLQVSYAESVFLFFGFASLIAMASHRYLLMVPLGVAAAFAHPGGLALAAALGIHVVCRLARHEEFPIAQRVWAALATAAIAVAGFAWPMIAAAVTGTVGAYFESELAWWRDYIGQVSFVPFTPWFLMTTHYWGILGVVAAVVIVTVFAWWLLRRSTRVLGNDILGFSGSYVAYLAAVFLPQQSLFRMLMPLSPLLGHPGLSRSPAVRRSVVAVCIALQPVAILLFWVIWPP